MRRRVRGGGSHARSIHPRGARPRPPARACLADCTWREVLPVGCAGRRRRAGPGPARGACRDQPPRRNSAPHAAAAWRGCARCRPQWQRAALPHVRSALTTWPAGRLHTPARRTCSSWRPAWRRSRRRCPTWRVAWWAPRRARQRWREERGRVRALQPVGGQRAEPSDVARGWVRRAVSLCARQRRVKRVARGAAGARGAGGGAHASRPAAAVPHIRPTNAQDAQRYAWCRLAGNRQPRAARRGSARHDVRHQEGKAPPARRRAGAPGQRLRRRRPRRAAAVPAAPHTARNPFPLPSDASPRSGRRC
jgi:hypothetical protein